MIQILIIRQVFKLVILHLKGFFLIIIELTVDKQFFNLFELLKFISAMASDRHCLNVHAFGTFPNKFLLYYFLLGFFLRFFLWLLFNQLLLYLHLFIFLYYSHILGTLGTLNLNRLLNHWGKRWLRNSFLDLFRHYVSIVWSKLLGRVYLIHFELKQPKWICSFLFIFWSNFYSA